MDATQSVVGKIVVAAQESLVRSWQASAQVTDLLSDMKAIAQNSEVEVCTPFDNMTLTEKEE